MFAFKKKYFLIIESIKDINLRNIKKYKKFLIIYRNKGINENIEHLYGGVYMKTKTNKNIFLPRGKYHPKHKIYVTSKNDKIKIFPEDLPLINYFYSSNQQKELVKKIINLKFLLSEKE